MTPSLSSNPLLVEGLLLTKGGTLLAQTKPLVLTLSSSRAFFLPEGL